MSPCTDFFLSESITQKHETFGPYTARHGDSFDMIGFEKICWHVGDQFSCIIEMSATLVPRC
jgi:hypothetical protein